MRYLKIYIYLALFYVCYSGPLLANENYATEYYPNKLNSCRLTKPSYNDYEPEKFQTTNNLLRKTGQLPHYSGNAIVVRVVIVDEDCIPASDANVYIWQVNDKGKYPYKALKTHIKKELLEINKDSTFIGNGSAITNNMGEVYFITTLPPSINDLSPHINIKIQHERLEPLETKLVLEGHQVLDTSLVPEIASLENLSSRLHDNCIPAYNFRVVLSGKSLKSY